MDLGSIETNKYIEWDESVENILSELGDEAQINAFLHKHSQIFYTRQNIKFQLPIIILSALSGTGNFMFRGVGTYTGNSITNTGAIYFYTNYTIGAGAVFTKHGTCALQANAIVTNNGQSMATKFIKM